MKLGEKIRRLRLLRGLTQEELAKRLGISELSIIHYEKGQRKPRIDILSKIAKILDVPIEYLLSEDEEIDERSIKTAKMVPVLARVPAGFPENISSDEIIEYIYLPDVPSNCFVCIVKGDSMAPIIKDGDYIVFVPISTIKNGDIVVVANEWGEMMVK